VKEQELDQLRALANNRYEHEDNETEEQSRYIDVKNAHLTIINNLLNEIEKNNDK
jgi:hypothetical protein